MNSSAFTQSSEYSRLHTSTVDAVDCSLLPMCYFLGSPLLIVNVASESRCTVQYESMRLLDVLYGPRGLKILAFPSNDFGAQEPRSVD